jgi:Ca-activated chloride channel family protein
MPEFRFAHLWLLILAGIPLLAVIGLRWRGRLGRPARLNFSDGLPLFGLPPTLRIRLRHLPDVLRAALLLCLLIAAARPQTGQAREVLRGTGLDLVVALDISGSMAALDFQPDNRLEVAKSILGDFVAGREFDRIGVVVFARDAYVLVPLTLDYDAVRSMLERVQLVTDVIDPRGAQQFVDGTAIGGGLLTAASLMRDSEARSRVVLLLTDGANNAGIDPTNAAEAAAALGMRVYTVGIGKSGEVPVPNPDGTLDLILSDLDEDALRAAAELGGGQYFRAEDPDALRRVAERIDALERSPVQRQTVVPWQDAAMGWLWAAFVLLLAERTARLWLTGGA